MRPSHPCSRFVTRQALLVCCSRFLSVSLSHSHTQLRGRITRLGVALHADRHQAFFYKTIYSPHDAMKEQTVTSAKRNLLYVKLRV